ncbi:MAG: DUF1844 domain-containing protein [Candidatus Aureabacteria bacterium]|nr:DUF1844 domain-containing protein [Candidatus Auribacterota bacterium]
MGLPNDTIHDTRFLSLMVSLHSSAWIALGKVANPLSGKVEKDLGAAQAHINLLETLQRKTRGNLSGEEAKLLASYLSILQLNYVDESSKDAKKEEGAAEAAADKNAPADKKGEA